MSGYDQKEPSSSPEATSKETGESAAGGRFAFPKGKRSFVHAVNAVSLALVLLPIAGIFLFIYAFGVDVVFHDQQRITPLFEKLYSGTLGFSDLFALHNEHRIMFPRIAMLLLGSLTAYSNVAELYFMQVFMIGTLVVFWLAFKADTRYRLLFFVPVAFLLFSFRQYTSTLQGLQIQVVFVMMFVTLAFYLLHIRGQGRGGKLALIAALASGVLASFSRVEGLFVWPIGLGQLLIAPLERRTKALLAGIWGTAGVASWVAYFATYEKPPSDRDLGAVLEQPIAGVQYFLGLAGSALFWEARFALICGVLLAGLAAGVLIWLLKDGKLGEYSFWLAVLAFGVAFLLATTVGRVETGGMMASRYASFSLPVVIGLYAILAKLAASKRSFASVGLFGALVGVVVFSMPVNYVEGLRAGYEDELLKERLAFITYTYETQPDAALEEVFPSAEIVGSNSRILDELDYNVFAYPPEPAPPPLSELSEVSTSTEYDIGSISGVGVGENEETITVLADRPALTISGWALDSRAGDLAGGVYIEIDGEPYPAFYGVVREALRERFGPHLGEAGFTRTISTEEISAGEHELSLLIVANDEESYYRTEPVTIEMG